MKFKIISRAERSDSSKLETANDPTISPNPLKSMLDPMDMDYEVNDLRDWWDTDLEVR